MIAVGGAKGGVKSILAANMGVCPASRGHRMVVIDLDLGAANLPFARKLKLMRAIKKIDADYVILDLGGDTSFNILDFFLSAEYGLVMTTCDPAANLDAHTFIKMALYRRLVRLFGPESIYRKFKVSVLAALIRDFVEPDQTESPGKYRICSNASGSMCPGGTIQSKRPSNNFGPIWW